MSRVVVTLLGIVVATAGLYRWLNYLPSGRPRQRKIRSSVIVGVSASVLLLVQVLWAVITAQFGWPGLVLLLVLGIASVVALATIEIALRKGGVQPSLARNMWEVSWAEWRARESLRDADYATPEFHQAYLRHYANFKVRSVDGVLYPTASDTGPITLTNGLRTTLPRSFSPEMRIIVFGGSTTFCAEVPDALTWPSQLQEMLNREGPSAVVENHSFSGATVISLAPRLVASSPRPGDVVVFYVGINEVAHQLLSSARHRRGIARLPGADRALEVLNQRLSLGLWIQRATVRTTWHLTTDGLERLGRVLDEVETECRTRGASLHLILQPWIVDRHSPTSGDRIILDEFPVGHVDALARGMELLRATLRSRPAAHVAAEIFNDDSVTPFIDLFHVNARGNQLIARYVHNVLRESLRIGR